MELKISKKLKVSLILLVLYIVVFCTIMVIRFPYTFYDLSLMEKEGYITTSAGEMPIIDIAKTVNMSSFHYLLKSMDNDYYVITATRFPFFKRYDMSRLMSMSDEEIYKYSDFLNEIIITRTGNTLNFSEEKHISGRVFLIVFIFFVAICNVFWAYKDWKKDMAMK